MAKTSSGEFLRKRLEVLSQPKKSGKRRLAIIVTATVAASLLGGGALAAKSLLIDKRITLAQAKELAAKGRAHSRFPVVVDELVLEQLNRYVGTPDGRIFMREALVRMKDFRGMIEDKLQRHNLPTELAAIPIVESGYANLPESANPVGCCSGLWQFRRTTGRLYGLRIDENVDERRESAKATDAAIRFLAHTYDLFQDWGLAVSAYNMGERQVQTAIDDDGSRDPWDLARRGKLKKYLSAVMAAVIIVENPELLD